MAGGGVGGQDTFTGARRPLAAAYACSDPVHFGHRGRPALGIVFLGPAGLPQQVIVQAPVPGSALGRRRALRRRVGVCFLRPHTWRVKGAPNRQTDKEVGCQMLVGQPEPDSCRRQQGDVHGLSMLPVSDVRRRKERVHLLGDWAEFLRHLPQEGWVPQAKELTCEDFPELGSVTHGARCVADEWGIRSPWLLEPLHAV